MQSTLHLLYPPHCLACDTSVVSDFGLCGPCWRDTAFIGGLVCDACGAPLAGDAGDESGDGGGGPEYCDDCLQLNRPWRRGRAALLYRDTGRRLVLALKHGDRHDLVGPAAGWMARAAAPILRPDMLVAPVPLHWWRLLTRRFNQSALLAGALAKKAGLAFCPDLLVRPHRTETQDGRDRDGRFANVHGAIAPHRWRGRQAAGRHVLLVDDVMTSGATLSAATAACLAAGAASVSVVTLARVAKDA